MYNSDIDRKYTKWYIKNNRMFLKILKRNFKGNKKFLGYIKRSNDKYEFITFECPGNKFGHDFFKLYRKSYKEYKDYVKNTKQYKQFKNDAGFYYF